MNSQNVMNNQSATNSENATQSTLIRAFMMLETIMNADKPLTSAYLAEDLDLPTATVHRIAQQLEEEGLLQREPNGKRFVGGLRLRRLATSILTNSVMTAGRHMILQGLSDEINETCNLTALDGNEIIYLDRIESNWPYRIHLPVGSHLPLHCTAAGKLFLANMKGSWRQRYLKAANLEKYTDKTISDIDELRSQLKRIADEEVGYDQGEYLDGMIALAVPVKNEAGEVCFSIAVHAPSARISLEELKQYLPQLNQAASKIAELECQELAES
jgi:DNA-binding IclR family transcriptional regulator